MDLFKEQSFIRRARRALRESDPKMATMVDAVGPFKPGLVERTFDALIHSIVHQQLSMKAARTISSRVVALCPRRRLSPAALSARTDQELRGAGLSRQKVSYLRDVCAHFTSGTIKPRRLPGMSDQEVIEQLVAIKGVGVWTAEMILMFNLQRPDVWPVDDLGLRQALTRCYRVPVKAKRDRLVRNGERFRPYRSVACWYLWSSLNSGVIPGFK